MRHLKTLHSVLGSIGPAGAVDAIARAFALNLSEVERVLDGDGEDRFDGVVVQPFTV